MSGTGEGRTSRARVPTLALKRTRGWLDALAKGLRQQGVQHFHWKDGETELQMTLSPAPVPSQLEETRLLQQPLPTLEDEPDPSDYKEAGPTKEQKRLYAASGPVPINVVSRLRAREAKRAAKESAT